jgi:hypothetical protein
MKHAYYVIITQETAFAPRLFLLLGGGCGSTSVTAESSMSSPEKEKLNADMLRYGVVERKRVRYSF